MTQKTISLGAAIRKAMGLRPIVLGSAAVAMALTGGGAAQAAGVTVSGGASAALTNSVQIDFLQIDSGAVVNGAVTNAATGYITGMDGVHAVYIDGSTVNGSLVNQGTVGTALLDVSAIYLNNATFTGGISNTGVIRSDVHGIVAENVSAATGISNSGVIQAGETGIDVEGANFGGGISNSGTIIAQTGTGIYVWQDSTFSGGVTNSGRIDSYWTGIYVHGDEIHGGINNTGVINSSDGEGISTNFGATSFYDGISNSGSIRSQWTGIDVAGGNFSGGITNSGQIRSQWGEGIYVDVDSFAGGINNSGTIDGGDYGIEVYANTFTGGITNSGTVIARSDIGIYVDPETFSGGINNSGLIDAYSTAVAVYASTFNGGFVNTGTIRSRDDQGVILEFDTFNGGINNSGVIDSFYTVIDLSGSVFNGGIVNTGTMIARDDEVIDNDGLSTFNGGIMNSGLMRSTSDVIDMSGVSMFNGGITNTGTMWSTDGYGIYWSGGTFTGGINNSGLIESWDSGIYVGGTSFDGGITNSGTIDSRDYYGIYVDVDTFTGGINNSGTITGYSTAIYATGETFSGGITNSGTLRPYFYLGIYADYDSFSGGINNSGLIDTTETGIYVGGTHFDGGIWNSGTIMSSFDYGIYADVSTFLGGIHNSGLIDSSATGIEVYADSFAGGIENSGTISVRDDYGVYVSANSFDGGFMNSGLIQSQYTGVYLDVNTFNGGFTNTGTIFTYSEYGVYLRGDTFAGGVNNSGLIDAGSTALGINVDTFSGDVVNSGTLRSLYEDGIWFAGTVTGQIVNSGLIDAQYHGIHVGGTVVGGIVNTGTIIGGQAAIYLGSETGATVITQAGGEIGGGGIDLSGGFADKINVSGGVISGNTWGAGGDDDIEFVSGGNGWITGNIDGIHQILVSGTGGLGGYTTNTMALSVASGGHLILGPVARAEVMTFDQVSGGTLSYELRANGASAQIMADTANLAGTIDVIPEAALYPDKRSYYDVIAANTLNGTFGNVTSQSLFLKPTVIYDGTTVDITLDRVAFNAIVGGGLTPNQNAVATGLENAYANAGASADSLALYEPLFLIDSASEYAQFLDAVSGSTYGNVLQVASYGQQMFNQSVLQGLLGGSLGGMNVAMLNEGDTHWSGGAAGDAAPSSAMRGGHAPGTWSVWVSGAGGWANADGDRNAVGFDQDSYGVVGGVDYQVNGQIMVGVAGGYVNDKVDFDNSSKTEIDTYEFALYGQYDTGTWFANGLFSYGDNDYEGRRRIVFGTVDTTAHSDYSGDIVSFYGEGGYTFKLDQFDVKPLFGIGYVDVSTDSFLETGAGIYNLQVYDGDVTSVTTNFGARASREWMMQGNRPIKVEGRAIWQHELDDTAQEVDAAFAVVQGSRFVVKGTDFSADSAILGIGVKAQVMPQGEVFLNFDAKLNGDYDSEAVYGGVRFTW